MRKYKCLKPLVLEVFGDDGSMLENESFTVEVGSVWEVDETTYRFIGSPESTRLLSDEYGWLEIHDDNIANNFVRI